MQDFVVATQGAYYCLYGLIPHYTVKKIVIEDTVEEIGNNAFVDVDQKDSSGNFILADVEFRGHVKRIGTGAFSLTNIGTVTMHKDVDLIEYDAFYVTTITGLDIKEGASIGSIGSGAFQNAKFGPSLILRGNNITFSGPDSFRYAKNVVDVKVIGKITQFGEGTFTECVKLNRFITDESVGDLSTLLFAYTPLSLYSAGKGSIGHIGDRAFRKDSSKTLTINCPVESINETAFEDSSIEEMTFKSISYITSDTFKSADKLKTLVLESGTTIGADAFYEKTSLVNVTIMGSVESIGDYAFFGCSNLEVVDIRGTIGNIGAHAFTGCSKLPRIKYTGSDKMKSIGDGAFYGCNNLASFNVPATVTSIGMGAFGNCPNLRSISVDSGNSVYKSVGGVLFDKSGSTLIQYPCGIISQSYTVPDDVVSVQGGAFAGCSNLASFVVSSGNQRFQAIDGVLFNNGCTSLISYPAGKSTNAYPVPTTVTSVEGFAFAGCSVEQVYIPKTVVAIKTDAFYACEMLESLIYQGSEALATDLVYLNNTLTNVCVPPDYPEILFGGISVTPGTALCTRFRVLFNQCYEADYSDGSFVSKKRDNATEWENQSYGCLEFVCDDVPKKNLLPCDDNPACYIGGGTCNEQTGKCTNQVTQEWYELSKQDNQCYEVYCDTDGWDVRERKNASDWIAQTNKCVLFGCNNESGAYKEDKVICNEKPAACYSATCNGETGVCTYEKMDKWYELIDQEDRCQHVVCDEEKGWILEKYDNVTEWESQTNDCYLYYCENEPGLVSKRVCNSSADVSRVCMNGESCIENWKTETTVWTVGIEFDGLDSNVTGLVQNLTVLFSSLLEHSSLGTEVDGDGKLLTIVIDFEDEQSANSVKEAVLNVIDSDDCQYGALCEAEKVDVYHNEKKPDPGSKTSSHPESTVAISGSHSIHHNVMAFVMVFVAFVVIVMH